MAETTAQQYRTLATASRVIVAFVFAAIVAVLVMRTALGRPVSTMLPAVLLLGVAGSALLAVSGSAKKKADEMEGEASGQRIGAAGPDLAGPADAAGGDA